MRTAASFSTPAWAVYIYLRFFCNVENASRNSGRWLWKSQLQFLCCFRKPVCSSEQLYKKNTSSLHISCSLWANVLGQNVSVQTSQVKPLRFLETRHFSGKGLEIIRNKEFYQVKTLRLLETRNFFQVKTLRLIETRNFSSKDLEIIRNKEFFQVKTLRLLETRNFSSKDLEIIRNKEFIQVKTLRLLETRNFFK